MSVNLEGLGVSVLHVFKTLWLALVSSSTHLTVENQRPVYVIVVATTQQA